MPMAAESLRMAAIAFGGGFDVGEAGDVLAHGNGDVGETLRTGDQVELADGREQDGVADAVGQVVEAAQLVSHGVDVAEAGVVERHAGQVLGIGHLVAGFQVRRRWPRPGAGTRRSARSP